MQMNWSQLREKHSQIGLQSKTSKNKRSMQHNVTQKDQKFNDRKEHTKQMKIKYKDIYHYIRHG